LTQKNTRNPILGDPEIIWPGTRVKISGLPGEGVILNSNGFGTTYTVRLNNRAEVTVHKSEVKELK